MTVCPSHAAASAWESKPELAAQRGTQLFQDALECPAEERTAFVQGACAGDAQVQDEVASLPAAAAGEVADASPTTEQPSERIGHYQLLPPIGSGGSGTVWLAEQQQPLRRNVALKILKRGMDTRQVVARFEAEHQALALRPPPNIAQVLDGGATATGRPYFVMELVKGVSIMAYGDEAQPSPRQQIDLFVPVGRAVQRGHQNGPDPPRPETTNVLVALHDRMPLVKVIDFSIAKSTRGTLTEKALFTEFWQLLGTPDCG